MAEPFKNAVDARAVARLAERFSATYPDFDRARLEAAAEGLGPLELKDRVRHVARALRAALPDDWAEATRIAVAAAPAAAPPEVGVSGGFWWWPVLQMVEDHGARDAHASLPALKAMTPVFSAEFAIRPWIADAPDTTWPLLAAWAADPDPHVRRLVSEGSRPRLPWGRRLSASIADPSPGLALLDRLVDDPSPYVRRSVANHLGDVAKDHVDRAIAAARAWLSAPGREDVVRHGLRSALKAGDPAVLALLGHRAADVRVDGLTVTPVVRVGEKAEITATIHAAEAARVRVDVVWSWPGARGWSSRTMRGADRELQSGESWTFRYRLSTRPVTTRPTRPGTHRIALRVLGVDVGPVEFALVA